MKGVFIMAAYWKFAIIGCSLLCACTDELKITEDSCRSNNVSDCNKLAHYYEEGKIVKQDYQKAIEIYNISCDLGDVNICKRIASFYESGVKINKDLSKAIKYYEKSCEFNNVESCNKASSVYLEGDGNVPKDISKGMIYAEKACILKDMKGCSISMEYYFQNRNFKKALTLSEISCNLNDGHGCNMLSALYRIDNDTIPKDLIKAEQYLEKSCNLNYGNGCFGLALIDEKRGEKNLEKSRELLKKSCDLGDDQGCKLYQKVKDYIYIGEWMGSEIKDDFDGTTSLMFINNAKIDKTKQSNVRDNTKLIFACQDGKAVAALSFDHVMSCAQEMKIGLKFDNEKPGYEYWEPVGEGCKDLSLNNSKSLKLLDKLTKYKTLTIQYSPYLKGTKTSSFDLEGTDRVRDSYCKIRSK